MFEPEVEMLKSTLAFALLFTTPAMAGMDCISSKFDHITFIDAYRECALKKDMQNIEGVIKANMVCYGEENDIHEGALFILPSAEVDQYWLIEIDDYVFPRLAEICPE